MITTLDFLNEVARTIKVGFPSMKRVHLERIDKLTTPAISVEIVSRKTSKVDSYRSYKEFTIDLIYFSPNNRISETLEVMDRVEALFSIGLKVKDRFLHVEGAPEVRFVEQDLHCVITFGWYDALKVLLASKEAKDPETNEVIPERIVEHEIGSTDINNTVDNATNKETDIEEDEESAYVGTAEQDYRYMGLLFMEI